MRHAVLSTLRGTVGRGKLCCSVALTLIASTSNAQSPPMLSDTTWVPLGPAPILGGVASGSFPVSGRVAAIAVHPSNPDIIYCGSASGGVWKTTNGTAAIPSWTALTDTQPTLNTGAIALAPSSPSIIYVGTGEANFARASPGHMCCGRGVLKSTDAGATWTLLGVAAFDKRSISKIVVHPTDPNVVFAASTLATNGPTSGFGVWKSTDGGANWTNTTVSITTTTSFCDLVMDPTNPNVMFAGVGQRDGAAAAGVYKTTNALAATPIWALVSTLPFGTAVGRVALAIAPSNSQTIYVAMQDGATTTAALFKWFSSTNGGASWTDRTANVPILNTLWYSNVMAVDPTNPNIVHYAGTTQLVRTTNGGATWTSINSGADGKSPHVDHHAMAFDSAGRYLDGNDGGINRYTPSTNLWVGLNGNLGTIQFVGIALDPVDRRIAFGGTQDNGTPRFTYDSWATVEGGDGGIIRFDPFNPLRAWRTNPVPSFGAGAYVRRSTDGGNSWASITTGITNASSSLFYPPITPDPGTNNRVLLGSNVVNVSTDGGSNWGRLPGDTFTFPAGIQWIGIGPASASTIYALSGGGVYVTTNNGVTWTQRNPAGVTDSFYQVIVDPTNSQIAYLTRDRYSAGGGHVFRTINAGVAWSDISGNLPDAPTNCIVLDANGAGTADDGLYVGNDIGVYSSSNLGATWARLASGLPNVKVTDLDLRKNLGILGAGTYGRGLWELSLVPLTGSCCRTDGACVIVTGAGCASQSGMYRGDGTICVTPSGSAQNFASTSVPVALPDLSTVNSTLSVSGFVGLAGKVTVRFSVTHTYDGDLVFKLIGPGGQSVLLASSVGDAGQGFTNTVFDDSAAARITEGVAPFTGSFRPSLPLSDFAGLTPNGTWTLQITDIGPGDTGTLDSWSIAVTPGVNPCTQTGACCTGSHCAIATQGACSGAFQGANTVCGPVGNPTTCCPANFNGVNGLSVQDIFDFLAAWFASNPSADFNHSGAISVQDIFDFLSAWFAGCA